MASFVWLVLYHITQAYRNGRLCSENGGKKFELLECWKVGKEKIDLGKTNIRPSFGLMVHLPGLTHFL